MHGVHGPLKTYQQKLKERSILITPQLSTLIMLRQHIAERPIVKMWKERQLKNQPRMQGTESKALEQLERNQRSVPYPEGGFENKIEFSLLYAMLASPDTYPRDVVLAMIDEEDFIQYTATKEGKVSYAQLSAIIAHCAETNPPNTKEDEAHSVSQRLSKKILQTVVRYANQHDLDRETEIDELFAPVKKVLRERVEKKELKAILPLYLGYSAALLTANPLPLFLGAAGLVAAPGSDNELKNMDTIISETNRACDVERTGLLDEGEDF